MELQERWPVLGRYERATQWLTIWADLGRSPRTIEAYARALTGYLECCERHKTDPMVAGREQIAIYLRELRSRPRIHTRGAAEGEQRVGLANATLQQRLVAVRLFYDYLIEEGLRTSNPVGRGQGASGGGSGRPSRGLLTRQTELPWIPSEEQWQAVLAVFATEPARNRLMAALAYDAALRREELCSLRTDDIDPSRRMLRIRAETTKTRAGRAVPYSACTGVLLTAYLRHRAVISRDRGPLFLSESRRNYGRPLTLWTWSKVVRRIAVTADVEGFSTHTMRHLCLTDLARMGWGLHAIATFAGHRSLESTLRYIHLSGRELAEKLNKGMTQIHAWRVEMLTQQQFPDGTAS